MFSNRMLAVAAVLAMAIPALGAAAPIVVPPVPEQLVEGHTVFTVIEVRNNTTVTEERFAAAVAVLVREYQADRIQARFPGVLWFNDQYLVNPAAERNADAFYRYPCGGAVVAVNQGDPDPRTVMAKVRASAFPGLPVNESANQALISADSGELSVGADSNNDTLYGTDPYVGDSNYYGEGDPTYDEYAWIGADADGGSVYADSVIGGGLGVAAGGAQVDYDESYLITDPNDHSWIIDKYDFYHRASEAGLASKVYEFPVWVVNILGSPVFLPDDGLSTCNPYYDLLTLPPDEVYDSLPDEAQSNVNQAGFPSGAAGTYDGLRCDTGTPGFGYAQDDPCMGYQEPSRNGFCYGGQAAADAPAGCDRDAKPLRLYNALLYFKLEDLTVPGATRDHSPPTTAQTDTNGCQTGTEWTCPAGDDNAEGNSHPFHPAAPPHEEREPCPPGFAATNPTNHGGSDTPGIADCTYGHATRNIDLYFDGAGRPFPPVNRDFDIVDFEGSTAPFQDFHSAYAGET